MTGLRTARGVDIVFFLERADHLDAVRRITGLPDVVIAPRDAEPVSDRSCVGYSGSFIESGDELVLDGGTPFTLQDYSAANSTSIAHGVVMRQSSAEGLASFLSDADTARIAGVFPDRLLSGEVLIDSRESFVRAGGRTDTLVRVHVTADGEYRDGPDGLTLGHVGDERADIEASAAHGAGRGRAFAGIVHPRVLEADLDDRPWLGRYAAALDLLRGWSDASVRPTVSGFGGHLVRSLDTGAAFPTIVSAAGPFLVTVDGDEFLLVDPQTHRRLRLGVDDARAAECLMATTDESSASALLSVELGRRSARVADLVRDVRVRISGAGIDLPGCHGASA